MSSHCVLCRRQQCTEDKAICFSFDPQPCNLMLSEFYTEQRKSVAYGSLICLVNPSSEDSSGDPSDPGDKIEMF